MLKERETATVIMTAQDCLCVVTIIVRLSLEKLEIFMMDLMIAALDFVHLKNHATLHRLKNCSADKNCMFGILNAYFRIFTICTSSEVLVLALVVESEPFKYTLWLCLGSGLSSG